MTPGKRREPSARDLLRVFHRRQRVILLSLLACFIAGIATCVMTARQYQARSVIQLQKSNSDALNLDSLIGGGSSMGPGDSLSANVDLQTQSSILQSDSLALKVIEETGLESQPQYQNHFSFPGWLLGLISPNGPEDPRTASLSDAPRRRDHLLKIFSKNLSVRAIAGTRLIEVSYSDSAPNTAADVVNHLVQGLIDYTFQTKFSATTEASQWLEAQLSDLKRRSENDERKVVELQKRTGLYGIGGSDLQGKPMVFSPTLDRLQVSTASLSQAEMNRVLKGSIYEVAKTGNADLISQLSGTSVAASASPGVTNSLSLIETLRQQEATAGAQVARDAVTFGPDYPRLKEERASLRNTQEQLQAEISRIAQRAKNDYDIAVKTSEGAQTSFQRDKDAAQKLNDLTIEYTITAKEADQSQALYQDLLKRLKEAGILEGLRSSNITIVDKALSPSKPSKPRVPVYLAISLASGVILGLCLALLVDAIDSKIQDTSDVEGLELPLLGIAPIRTNLHDLTSGLIDPPTSPYTEAIRRLRSVILISRSASPPQVILITSGSAREGKSTLSLNLAASLAQSNKKVLLLEADLRRPVIGKRLSIADKIGLSTLLSSQGAPFEPVSIEGHSNLWVLPAGPVPPFPSELLASDQLRAFLEGWRREFDFIVIDSPPILPVTDAEILQDHADTTILLARTGVTSRVALERAYSLLLPHAENKGHINIGIVLNAVKPSSAAYYGYYGGYGSKYSNYYVKGDGDATV